MAFLTAFPFQMGWLPGCSGDPPPIFLDWLREMHKKGWWQKAQEGTFAHFPISHCFVPLFLSVSLSTGQLHFPLKAQYNCYATLCVAWAPFFSLLFNPTLPVFTLKLSALLNLKLKEPRTTGWVRRTMSSKWDLHPSKPENNI